MKKDIFCNIAQLIQDFSFHRINKGEMYDKICELMLTEITEEEKMAMSNKEYTEKYLTDKYMFPRNWLLKK